MSPNVTLTLCKCVCGIACCVTCAFKIKITTDINA